MSRYFRRKLFEYPAFRTVSKTRSRQMTTLLQQRIFTPEVACFSARTGRQRPFELLTNVRQLASRANQSGKTKKNMWNVIRIIFLVTGGLVWCLPIVVYVGYRIGLINVEIQDKNPHDERTFHVFDISEDLEQEAKSEEINAKYSALMKILHQLRLEGGIVKRFGGPLELIGYKGKSWIENTENGNTFDIEGNNNFQNVEAFDESQVSERKKDGMLEWCTTCIVAGPSLTGVLELKFNKNHSEWIPVSLRLEGLQKAGDIICDVSGSLPNGVSRFTRLSKD